MSYSAVIMKTVKNYPVLEIIDAQKLYNDKFKGISELAYYQAFSRMTKNGDIARLTKGIYCVPKKGRFGMSVSNENNILEYCLGKNMSRGVVVGYRMYNKYRLTTQISKSVEVYSNVVSQEIRKIDNVVIHRSNLRFDKPTVKTIELLELLQNYKRIEDLNAKRFIDFIRENILYYDEKTLKRVIDKIGYKKSTLASLKNVLDYYDITNSVDEYLSGTSKYEAIKLEEWNESTSEKR